MLLLLLTINLHKRQLLHHHSDHTTVCVSTRQTPTDAVPFASILVLFCKSSVGIRPRPVPVVHSPGRAQSRCEHAPLTIKPFYLLLQQSLTCTLYIRPSTCSFQFPATQKETAPVDWMPRDPQKQSKRRKERSGRHRNRNRNRNKDRNQLNAAPGGVQCHITKQSGRSCGTRTHARMHHISHLLTLPCHAVPHLPVTTVATNKGVFAET